MTNRLLSGIQRVALLGTLLALGSQCTRQAVEKKADTPCRLIRAESVAFPATSGATAETVTSQTDYAYDGGGRLVGIINLAKSVGGPGGAYQSSTNETYTYDLAGFLGQKAVTEQFKSALTTTTSSKKTVYTYASGRLAQATELAVNRAGLETKIARTYTYDAAGTLTQRLDQTTYPVIPVGIKEGPIYPDGFTETWTYRNGLATDFVRKMSGKESRPYTLQDGLVLDAVQDNTRTTYQYNGQKQQTKMEFWADGKPQYGIDQAYAAAKKPESSLPRFAGFPITTEPFGVPGVVTAISFLVPSATGGLYNDNNTRIQYTLTGAGNVKSASEVTMFTREGQPGATFQLKTARTYTYDGLCD